MPEVVSQGLGMVSRGLEIIGASILIAGFLITTVRFFRATRRQGAVAAVEPYRKSLGRSVLIGLEILLAATIIKTITIEPTVENLILLSIMVVIRTVLGWSMVLEIDGRWPWQRPPPDAAKSPAD